MNDDIENAPDNGVFVVPLFYYHPQPHYKNQHVRNNFNRLVKLATTPDDI